MDTPDLRLTIDQGNGICRVGFLDRQILDEASVQMIAAAVCRLIDEADNPKMLISFEGVEHLSSAALGALITINNKIKEKGGQLRLSDIEPRIYEIFQMTKLNQLFQIHENAEQAAKSFQ